MREIIFNKKNIILLGVVVLLLGLYAIFILFFDDEVINKANYLYVGDSLIWRYKNNQFVQVVEAPEGVQEYDYTVYDGLEKKNANYAQYVNNKWNFLGKNYTDLNIKDFRIAYTGLKDIEVADYNFELYDSNDDKYISMVNNTSNQEELNYFKNSLVKVRVDLDGDGNDETLYTMSSYSLTISDIGSEPLSYMFVVDDGEVSVIAESSGQEPFNIIDIFDIDYDGLFEVVVSKGVLNLPTLEDCYQIYEFNNGKYQLKQDCIME